MEKYNIELREEEVLVLSDFLYRMDKNDSLKELFVDQAEQRAIWNLDAYLEKINPSILGKTYLESVKDARNKLRDKE